MVGDWAVVAGAGLDGVEPPLAVVAVGGLDAVAMGGGQELLVRPRGVELPQQGVGGVVADLLQVTQRRVDMLDREAAG